MFQFQHELQVLKTTFYSASFLKPQKTTHLHRVFFHQTSTIAKALQLKASEGKDDGAFGPRFFRDFGDWVLPKTLVYLAWKKYGWRENGGLKPTISMGRQWGYGGIW